jgi:hypothetical protein
MIHPKSKELELPTENWINGYSWPQERLSDCDGSSTVERGTVAPETVGSSPTRHPIRECGDNCQQCKPEPSDFFSGM